MPILVTFGCDAVASVPVMFPLAVIVEQLVPPVTDTCPRPDTSPVVEIVQPSKLVETVTSPPLSNFK